MARPAKSTATRTTSLLRKGKFVDAPPERRRGGGGGSQWDEVVDHLHDNPGKWMEFQGVPVSSATTLKKRGLEAVTRDADSKTGLGTIYVRFNPEAKQD